MSRPEGWFSDDNAALYKEFASRVPSGGAVVEVGVFLGRSLSSLEEVAVERDLQIFAVDPWAGPWRPSAGARKRNSKEKVAALSRTNIYEGFQAWLRTSPLYDRTTVLRLESWEAARQFADRSVDLIHIDGHHGYYPVLLDLHVWRPKMKSGAAMIGHDFVNHHPGVIAAVNRYFGASSVRSRGGMWFVTL